MFRTTNQWGIHHFQTNPYHIVGFVSHYSPTMFCLTMFCTPISLIPHYHC